MGKTLYFDCFSGISGDMMLGALLDLGLPIDALREALGSLAVDHGTVEGDKVLRAGVASTKFRVVGPAGSAAAAADPHPTVHRHSHGHGGDHHHRHDQHDEPQAAAGVAAGHAHRHDEANGGHSHEHVHGDHGHYSLEEITRQIGRSALSPGGKARARHLFERLAEAEAAIHDMPVERVHLHEVGALDSIVDIVGAVFGLEWLGATTIVSSPINVGSGTVRCAHGVFPVPAPATARLLQGVPIYAEGVKAELTTPTGALLVTAYAERFGAMPPMRVSRIGYGAGDRDFPGQPNVLRLMVGDSDGSGPAERIVAIECEIDDMNPQLFGPLMDWLYEAGALEVYYAAIQMKKNRPGTLVTVIAPPDRRADLHGVLFAQTTTIGVRYQEMSRERLDREFQTIDTPAGPIRFKVARRSGGIVNAAPEFEDCVRAAAARGLPIKDVQAIAVKAWLDRRS